MNARHPARDRSSTGAWIAAAGLILVVVGGLNLSGEDIPQAICITALIAGGSLLTVGLLLVR
jgi:hypothetical protein